MIHITIAAYLSALILSVWGFTEYLGPWILEHDHLMAEIQKDATEEAKHRAFGACLRKHTVKECRE